MIKVCAEVPDMDVIDYLSECSKEQILGFIIELDRVIESY